MATLKSEGFCHAVFEEVVRKYNAWLSQCSRNYVEFEVVFVTHTTGEDKYSKKHYITATYRASE